MDAAWAWIALAGTGALHGLVPAAGCGLVVARTDRAPCVASSLAAWAAGHLASIVLVAALVPLSLAVGVDVAAALPWIAGMLVLLVVARLLDRLGHGRALRVGWLELASAGFLLATLHGAGWMLVPAFVPLCAGDEAVRAITASGSVRLALAALGVHLAAMLAVAAAGAAFVGHVLPRLGRN